MVGGNDAVTAANISTANGGHGLQYNGTLRGTYTGNISTVNSGSGFDFTLGSSYGLATGNIGFQNSWRGVEVDSQSLHCSIVGNSFYQNYESGMTNFSSSECIYMGNQVVDNNLGNTTFSGIDITTDGVNPANNILLLGNVAIGHGLHQAYGLNISSSSPESFGVIIDGNSFAGNAIGSVNLGTTTGVQAMNNLAWTTQAKGTGSIAAGATNSGPIAHGLALTPTYSNFVLEFANGPAFAIGTVWIDNITATHFTVYCMTAPGGAGINFGWAANKY